MRACGGRGAAACGFARFRALDHRELQAKRCEVREAAPRAPKRALGRQVHRGRTCAALALTRGRRALHGSSSLPKTPQWAARFPHAAKRRVPTPALSYDSRYRLTENKLTRSG